MSAEHYDEWSHSETPADTIRRLDNYAKAQRSLARQYEREAAHWRSCAWRFMGYEEDLNGRIHKRAGFWNWVRRRLARRGGIRG